MKKSKTQPISSLAVFAALGLAGQATAAVYNSSITSNDSIFDWDADASWTETGYPNAAGDTGKFGGTGQRTANFSSDITVGHIAFDVTTERSLSLVGAANTLTFDSGIPGVPATIYGARSPLRSVNLTASEIVLNSDLVFARSASAAMNANRTTTINGAITGTGGLTVWLTNDSQSASNNRYLQFFASSANIESTFSGGTTIIGAGTDLTRPIEMRTNHNNAFGTGTLDLSGNLIWTMTNSHTVEDFVFNGVALGDSGTYSSSDLNTRFSTSAFSGIGTLTVVPEPSAAILGVLGVLALAGRRRRG